MVDGRVRGVDFSPLPSYPFIAFLHGCFNTPNATFQKVAWG